mgnify:CR=1 FL=1
MAIKSVFKYLLSLRKEQYQHTDHNIIKKIKYKRVLGSVFFFKLSFILLISVIYNKYFIKKNIYYYK